MHGECDKIGHVKERRGGRTAQLPPVNPRCIFRGGIWDAEIRQMKCKITGANSVLQVTATQTVKCQLAFVINFFLLLCRLNFVLRSR